MTTAALSYVGLLRTRYTRTVVSESAGPSSLFKLVFGLIPTPVGTDRVVTTVIVLYFRGGCSNS